MPPRLPVLQPRRAIVPAVQVQRDVRRLARSLRRRRRLRLTVRALSVSLSMAIVGLAIQMAGVQLRWPIIVFPAAFVCIALIIRAWTTGPSLLRLVREYDRHFQLQEVLSSGFEAARNIDRNGSESGPVVQRLIEQTLLTTYAIQRRIAARPLIPWREVEILTAVVLVGLGFLMVGRQATLPNVIPLALQPLPTPAVQETT